MTTHELTALPSFAGGYCYVAQVGHGLSNPLSQLCPCWLTGMHHCGILVPSLRSPQGRQREAEQQEQKRPGFSASQEAEDPEFRSSFGWVSLHRQTPQQLFEYAREILCNIVKIKCSNRTIQQSRKQVPRRPRTDTRAPPASSSDGARRAERRGEEVSTNPHPGQPLGSFLYLSSFLSWIFQRLKRTALYFRTGRLCAPVRRVL